MLKASNNVRNHLWCKGKSILTPAEILSPWARCNRTFMLALTHWGRVTHICVVKLTIIGSDNGLAPGRCQAIIWTNDGMLSIGPLGTNFSEILIGIQTFSFKKMEFKMSSSKWLPFCLGLNVLNMTWLTNSMELFVWQWFDLTLTWLGSELVGNVSHDMTWDRSHDLHASFPLQQHNWKVSGIWGPWDTVMP